ncbi:MAG: beta-galactosidase [Methylovulum sp.]
MFIKKILINILIQGWLIVFDVEVNSMKLFSPFNLLVFLAVSLNTVSFVSAATIPEPSGVYALIGARTKVSQTTIDNADVSGYVLRDKWALVEPNKGAYDWSYLDSEIARLASNDKKIMLSVISGSIIGSPSWLSSQGIKTFSFIKDGKTQTIPLFWDPVFLEQKKNFIRQLGARYSANKQLVSIHAHCMNANTDDWFLPATSTDIKNLLALGYTSQKAIDTCKQIIDTTMTAFPNQVVRMALSSVNTAMDPALKDSDYVQKQIVAYANTAYPGRFYAQRHNLNAKSPDPLLASATDKMGGWRVIFDNQPYSGAQMLWWVTNDTTCKMNKEVKPCDPATVLRNSINLGIHYGMRYLEIYEVDIRNSALDSVISDAASALGNP